MSLIDDEPDDRRDLGPCCVCEAIGPSVRNILTLPQLAPIAGRGWGCIECNLPMDGALAIVCDPCFDLCFDDHSLLRYACKGWPGRDGRVPIRDLRGHHAHDPNVHRGEYP